MPYLFDAKRLLDGRVELLATLQFHVAALGRRRQAGDPLAGVEGGVRGMTDIKGKEKH